MFRNFPYQDSEYALHLIELSNDTKVFSGTKGHIGNMLQCQ